MKSPICPKCKYSVKRTMGLIVQGDVIYHLNRERTGWVSLTGNVWKGVWKMKRPDLLGFYCRSCRTMFPESMWKEIKDYLKESHLLKKLTGH